MSSEIIIVGGGVVGCTIAYYLSNHPGFNESTKITLLEASPSGVAQGASGKAGGLVANWAYPQELVDVSYPEHIRLAEKHNGKERWGWRFVGCGNWEGKGEDLRKTARSLGSGVGGDGERKSLEKTEGLDNDGRLKGSTDRKMKGLPDDLLWVKEHLTESYSPMASEGSTAQVHPYLFTTAMLQLAQSKGVKFLPGVKVAAINIDQQNGCVTGVTYDHVDGTKTLSASYVILSAGAWSPSLVSILPISATRAHSVVIKPQPSTIISPYVLFTKIRLPSLSRIKVVSPEIYARPNNEVYACGPGDSSTLPSTVDDVQVDEDACQSIYEQVSSISLELRAGTVEKKQACFLPVVSTGGGPIIGEAKKIANGLIIATGHTCWGICNAPGTAKAVSELVMEGRIKCASLGKLEPSGL